MRKNFQQQLSIDIIPISLVKIPEYKRDELPPMLTALQYIFVTPELNMKVFKIMEEAILKGKKRTGRIGMDLWHILVLGVIRTGMDINYDRLWDFANHHKLIRQIMGIELESGEGKKFPYSTIRDNVYLLNESIIEQINEVVVKAGHQLIKKKEEKFRIKADTYVLETNVHFPTDINLLWDSARKCVDVIVNLMEDYPIKGWRKYKLWYRDLKRQYRILSKACQSGGKGKDKNIKKEAMEYLQMSGKLNEKINQSKDMFYSIINTPIAFAKLLVLENYQELLIKHIDLVKRRLINEETIPQAEKIFSIFEPHTEWIKKGKSNNKVELGHNILVASDQFNFIVFHKVLDHQSDSSLGIPLVEKLMQILGENEIASLSFDKGFWNKEVKELLALYIPRLVMPKKGKKNKMEQEEESSKEFKKLRNQHSAIESNINSLEHHGLNRCPDKGKKSFVKYTAQGILSYNLHRLGMVLLTKKEKIDTSLSRAA